VDLEIPLASATPPHTPNAFPLPRAVEQGGYPLVVNRARPAGAQCRVEQ
jgi:hypothetical protein